MLPKFIIDIGKAFKWIGTEIEKGLAVLFGATQAVQFIQSAESLLETSFGQVLMQAGSQVVQQLGENVSPVTIITALAEKIGPLALQAGVSVGESLAHALAALVIAKLQTGLASVASTIQTATSA
jgi:hypothetical protein